MNITPLAVYRCKMAYFKKGMAEGKSAVTPLRFKIEITTDWTFKIRYITSLNFQWFKKYNPSKLKEQKINPSK